jgi:hypothetical protein
MNSWLTLTDGTIRMVGYVQASAACCSSPAMSLTMHGGSADGLVLVFKAFEY